MTNVTLKNLPAGNAELHYAARVEPHRQGLTPRPTPLQSLAVSAVGEVTFDLTPKIQYVVFGSDGKGRSVMHSTWAEITSLSPASIVHGVATTLRVLGSGFTRSSRVRIAGSLRATTFISSAELQVIGLNIAAAGTPAVEVENAGRYTAPVTLTVT